MQTNPGPMRPDDVGFLLAKASQRFNERLVAAFAARGYPEVRGSFGSVLVPLFHDGDQRIGELGRSSALSKQAMTALVRDCEAAGLVTRRRDPDDGRAFRIGLTERGRRFQSVAAKVRAELEAELGAALGERKLQTLIDALKGVITP